MVETSAQLNLKADTKHQEQQHLDNQQDQNYGAIPDRESQRQDAAQLSRNNENDDVQSQMGESVLYRDHLYSQQQQQAELSSTCEQTLNHIKAQLAFYCILLAVLIPLSVFANQNTSNVPGASEEITDNQNGYLYCQNGLPAWYFIMTGLTGIKITIEFSRYVYLLKNEKENLWLYFLGHHFLMTSLFCVFFGLSNRVFWSDYNNCAESPESIVKLLYSFFFIFFILSYLVFFYLIIASCVMCQSGWLIHTMVSHRIESMRRRDAVPENQQRDNDQDEFDTLFADTLLGGLIRLPMPIPEIISTLESRKFSRKDLNTSATTCSCPICWTDFQENQMVTPLICNEKHLFHSTCIEQWVRKGNNSCPLCRKRIANL